jgi:hypothetical protein
MGYDYCCLECGKLTYGKHWDEECDDCYNKLYEQSENEQNEGDESEHENNDIEQTHQNEKDFQDNNIEQSENEGKDCDENVSNNIHISDFLKKGQDIINSSQTNDEKIELFKSMFMDDDCYIWTKDFFIKVKEE